MATISKNVTMSAPKEDVFEALTTVEGLKSWFTPGLEGVPSDGSEFTSRFASKDGPFTWLVTDTTPGSVVRWKCTAGPGNSVGTTATFSISEQNGQTTVSLDHEGFEDSDAAINSCTRLWGNMMDHLQKFVESHQPDPAFL